MILRVSGMSAEIFVCHQWPSANHRGVSLRCLRDPKIPEDGQLVVVNESDYCASAIVPVSSYRYKNNQPALESNSYLWTMARRFHRQNMLHRDYKRDVVSVFHQRSQSARSVFDTKRRSDREQPRRHRSDDIRRNARNTEKNNEISQKEKLMSCRNDERIVVDRDSFKNSRAWPKSLIEEIKDMLKIEDHHVIYFKDITNVEWCPKFVKPDIRGHVRGGKDLLHHRCRDCRRLCLHLLGRPGSKRQCLKCSRKWDKKYIPVWYYHYGCKYC